MSDEKYTPDKIQTITAAELAKKKLHPIAETYPDIPDHEYQVLKASIEQNGLDEPIVIWNDMIVDGRHRAKAVIELGINAKIKDVSHLSEVEMVRFVKRANAIRRHLTPGQWAAYVEENATRTPGGDQTANLQNAPTMAALASAVRVSARSAATVREVRKKAPELLPEIKAGRLAPHAAKQIADLPERERDEAIAKVNRGDIEGAKVSHKTANKKAAKALVTNATSSQKSIGATKRGFHPEYTPLFEQLDRLPLLLAEHPAFRRPARPAQQRPGPRDRPGQQGPARRGQQPTRRTRNHGRGIAAAFAM